MKKSAALAMMLCLIGTLAFSEAQNTSAAPHADRGDLIANAGALFGYYGFGIGGGVEYIFGRWDIIKSAPLTFGAAAKASFGYPGLMLDLGAMATAHFGLNGFTSLPRFLRNFDWYWGLGLGGCVGAYFGAGPLVATGTSYFINPNLAIHADIYVPYFIGLGVGYSGMLGIRWKL